MGWDAYATIPAIDPSASDESLLTPVILEAFRHANQKLAGIHGVGSDNLESGNLGGLSLGILSHATGIQDYDESSADGHLLWSPNTVQRAYAAARWDLKVEDNASSFLVTEARLFLEVCAKHGLTIRFDW